MNTPAILSDDHLLAPPPHRPVRLPTLAPTKLEGIPALSTLPGLERASRSRPQHLLDLACKVLRASWGGVGLFSASGELLDHITTGLSEEVAGALGRSPALLEFFAHMVQASAPVRGCDLLAHLGASANDRDSPRSTGAAPVSAPAFLALPMTSLGRYRGVLYVVREGGQPEFVAEDEEKLKPIGACLDQASLFEEAHLLAQLRLLNQVIQAAAGNLDLSRVLSVALRELDRHLPMHRGAVLLLDESGTRDTSAGGNNFLAAASPRATATCTLTPALVLKECSSAFDLSLDSLGLLRGSPLLLEETPFACCVQYGQAHFADLRRPEEQVTPLARSLAEEGATAYFAVPMRVADQTVGVLLSVCHRPTGFTGEQIQLLYLVADLLGPAISNCLMLNRLRAACDELHQTQGHLVQSEKMRALGELAGGMAHDFNNSLCGVLGFLELALMDPGQPVACRGYLESARACALDAAQSVSRVQDFARRQRNEQAWETVEVNELARLTLELTRPRWESLANLRQTPIIAQVVPSGKGMVKGNAAELRNALTNLVINAIDAMPQGGTLTLRTWSTATDAFLAVQDTGLGIDEPMQKRLFEPFFSTKGERGTGLGLSVVFGIVKRHDGEITVDSAPGRGSTFTIRLPLAAAVPSTPAAMPPAQAPQPAAATRPLRILVIDDEESIRRFLGNALKQLGHQARLTNDAPSGLAAFVEEEFDVVVTDLGLPGVSGEEVARLISERSPRTPVILLTGWADQIQAEQRSLAGVACVLGKPVTLTALLATLARVVGDAA